MSPATQITGGEWASLIVAITGVGYFVLNLFRKPKTEGDPEMLRLLEECLQTKGRQSIELKQLREWKRARLRER